MEDLPIWVMIAIFFMFVLVPLFLLWAGVTVIKNALKFKEGAERVLGTVVSVRAARSAGIGDTAGGTAYYPTYEYEGLDGKKYQGETAAGSGGWNYRIGCKVMRYNAMFGT